MDFQGRAFLSIDGMTWTLLLTINWGENSITNNARPHLAFQKFMGKTRIISEELTTKGVNDIESNMSYSCPHIYSETNNVILIQIIAIAQRGVIEPM